MSEYFSVGVLIGPQAVSEWLNTVSWGFDKAIMWVHNRCSVSFSLTSAISSATTAAASAAPTTVNSISNSVTKDHVSSS